MNINKKYLNNKSLPIKKTFIRKEKISSNILNKKILFEILQDQINFVVIFTN